MSRNTIRFLLGAGSLAAAHVSRYPLGLYREWLLVIGAYLCGHALLRLTYYRSGTPWPDRGAAPRQLRLRWFDPVLALVAWLDAFRRTYAVAPGLYHTGPTNHQSAPLLVTANHRLTVLALVRHLRRHPSRVLVVDTDGINVWCSAAKGVFSAEAILTQLARYGLEGCTLILPKLSLAGVKLQSLRAAGHRPVIGPVHARDVPGFLAAGVPYRDQTEARLCFGLRARIFTWLPGLLQYIDYGLMGGGVLLGLAFLTHWPVPTSGLGLVVLVGTLYPLLFPWIPGQRFAVKGLWLATGVTVACLGVCPDREAMAVLGLLTYAVGLAVGLSYAGNSAVSNYPRVRREVARFLPLTVLLFVASFAGHILRLVEP